MRGTLIFVIIFFLVGSVTAQGLSFDVDTPLIKNTVRSGEKITDDFVINNLNDTGEFSLSVFPEASFISIDKEEIFLESNQNSVVRITLDSQEIGEGIHVGKAIVNKGEESYFVPVIFEVESRDLLFDVASELPSGTLAINPGGELVVDVRIFNLRSSQKNATIEYGILDFEGNIITSDIQETDIERRSETTRVFDLPRDLEIGNYVFYSTIKSEGSVGVSSFMFSVTEKSDSSRFSGGFPILIFAIIVFAFVFTFFVLNHLWTKSAKEHARNWKKRIAEIEKINLGDVAKKIKKLEYQKNVLERAYKKRYVTRSSYEEGRKEINKLINRLKKRL